MGRGEINSNNCFNWQKLNLVFGATRRSNCFTLIETAINWNATDLGAVGFTNEAKLGMDILSRKSTTAPTSGINYTHNDNAKSACIHGSHKQFYTQLFIERI